MNRSYREELLNEIADLLLEKRHMILEDDDEDVENKGGWNLDKLKQFKAGRSSYGDDEAARGVRRGKKVTGSKIYSSEEGASRTFAVDPETGKLVKTPFTTGKDYAKYRQAIGDPIRSRASNFDVGRTDITTKSLSASPSSKTGEIIKYPDTEALRIEGSRETREKEEFHQDVWKATIAHYIFNRINGSNIAYGNEKLVQARNHDRNYINLDIDSFLGFKVKNSGDQVRIDEEKPAKVEHILLKKFIEQYRLLRHTYKPFYIVSILCDAPSFNKFVAGLVGDKIYEVRLSDITNKFKNIKF